jgi:ribose 5-phosphate isomerase A
VVGIPLVGLDQVDQLDAAFDGADAVDPRLDLIKGLGGALLREKVVASVARRFIVLVGESKLTPRFGEGYCRKLPVEVVPFAIPLIQRRIGRLGFDAPTRLQADQSPYITDNGNAILDCDISAGLSDPRGLDRHLRTIPGVVETGLFLGMASLVLVDSPAGIRTLAREDHDPNSP